MLGSTDTGPSTFIINSFSDSHWRSCGSELWNTSTFLLDRSRVCFLSATQSLTSAQPASGQDASSGSGTRRGYGDTYRHRYSYRYWYRYGEKYK